MNPSRSTHVTDSPWPHRLGMLLVCVTFPLIWVGGLVTTYHAGMAVEDWPTTYGYNLFLYPWTTWIFGPFDLFIEHGHRLLGATVGMVAIALVAVTFRDDSRPRARWAALGALALVVFQGVLGGLRVRLDQRTLAMIHGCVGPAFLAYSVGLTVYLSRWWKEMSHSPASETDRNMSARFRRLALLTMAFIYLQIIAGARVRHIPADASPRAFQIAVFFHLILAMLVAFHVGALLVRGRIDHVAVAARRPSQWMAGLIVLQIGLGCTVWILRYAWPFGLSERLSLATGTLVASSFVSSMVVTAHVAMGSLLLALAVTSWMRSCRLARSTTSVAAASLVSTSMMWEVSR